MKTRRAQHENMERSYEQAAQNQEKQRQVNILITYLKSVCFGGCVLLSLTLTTPIIHYFTLIFAY